MIERGILIDNKNPRSEYIDILFMLYFNESKNFSIPLTTNDCKNKYKSFEN